MNDPKALGMAAFHASLNDAGPHLILDAHMPMHKRLIALVAAQAVLVHRNYVDSGDISDARRMLEGLNDAGRIFLEILETEHIAVSPQPDLRRPRIGRKRSTT